MHVRFPYDFLYLLSKNANYQQLNFIERVPLYDEQERNYYLCTSSMQGFRKAIWKIKTKTFISKMPQLGLLYSFIVPNNIFIIYNILLPCIVTMPPLINTFDINILKAFWNDALIIYSWHILLFRYQS